MKKCFDNKVNSNISQLLWNIYVKDSPICSQEIRQLQKSIPNPSFGYFQQADAHEWLRCLLEKLRLEVILTLSVLPIKKLFD